MGAGCTTRRGSACGETQQVGRKRTGERESHHDQKRQEDTHGEEERHRRAETDTHTDSGGKRGRGQKNEKGRGLERTAEQKPETQGGNTEMGRLDLLNCSGRFGGSSTFMAACWFCKFQRGPG